MAIRTLEEAWIEGDIALIKFNGRLPKGYRKIQLGQDSDIRSGGKVTLAGYGISNAQTKTGAGRLRKADVQI